MEGVQRGVEQYREGHGRKESGADRSVERYTEGYIKGCTEMSEDAESTLSSVDTMEGETNTRGAEQYRESGHAEEQRVVHRQECGEVH